MTTNDSLSHLSGAELLNEVKRLAAIEREATADLIRSLAEVKAQGLHLAMGYSSMLGYCTRALHLSEHAAYARIAAARVATQFPVVMDLLIQGAITLTTVAPLARAPSADCHSHRVGSSCRSAQRVTATNPVQDVTPIGSRGGAWAFAVRGRALN